MGRHIPGLRVDRSHDAERCCKKSCVFVLHAYIVVLLSFAEVQVRDQTLLFQLGRSSTVERDLFQISYFPRRLSWLSNSFQLASHVE